jgi:hypothetical protein
MALEYFINEYGILMEKALKRLERTNTSVHMSFLPKRTAFFAQLSTLRHDDMG